MYREYILKDKDIVSYIHWYSGRFGSCARKQEKQNSIIHLHAQFATQCIFHPLIFLR